MITGHSKYYTLNIPALRRFSEIRRVKGIKVQFKTPTAWKEAHADRTKHVPKSSPDEVITKVLVVDDEGEKFSATWQLKWGVWSCVKADHRLRWMMGKSQGQVHLTLIKMGLGYDWNDFPKVSDPTGVKHVSNTHSAGNAAGGTATEVRMTPESEVGNHAEGNPNPANTDSCPGEAPQAPRVTSEKARQANDTDCRIRKE